MYRLRVNNVRIQKNVRPKLRLEERERERERRKKGEEITLVVE